MDVLISGAGVAGPTLAYWLQRYGHNVTIVERSPHLRTGGYIIDFWGGGYDVADRMGLLPVITSKGYHVQEVRFVDSKGRRAGGFPVKSIAGLVENRFISLPRGDLAAAVFAASQSSTETLFDEEVTAIALQGKRVRVSFRTGGARRYDLVVGAGGLHSPVRSLLFGPEQRFARYLGYKVAAFEVEPYEQRDELVYVSYGRPGIQASRFAMRDGSTMVLLVMADDAPGIPDSVSAQKAYLHRRFERAGWECDAILAALDASDELYFDDVAQIHTPRWSLGRAALVGDAAFCPSLLAGEGTGLAMIAAYVLAGEIHASNGDVEAALERYETRLRPLIERKQKAARQFARSFAPRTQMGLWLRNLATRAMVIPWVSNFIVGVSLRDDFPLPVYD